VAPRGQVRIDVTFEINGDGLVNVTACDQETGEQASTTISLNSGLSEQELQQILEQAPTDRVEARTGEDAPNEAPSPQEDLVPLPSPKPAEDAAISLDPVAPDDLQMEIERTPAPADPLATTENPADSGDLLTADDLEIIGIDDDALTTSDTEPVAKAASVDPLEEGSLFDDEADDLSEFTD
jgi:hypothetical protein